MLRFVYSQSCPSIMFYHRFVIRVTRWVPLVERELFTLKEYNEFTPSFCRVQAVQSSFLCFALWIIICPFVLFLLAIIWFVLRLTASDQPFGIFKLFLPASHCIYVCIGCYLMLTNNRKIHLQTMICLKASSCYPFLSCYS